jgi:hypothetical protein
MNFEDAIVLAKSRSDCEPKNIDTLVRVVRETASLAGNIAECGSYRCGATIALAAADPLKSVYAFDLFGGLPYGTVGFENFADSDFTEIEQTVAPFSIILVRGKHEETVPEFAEPVFKWSMIFMDSDHYSSHQVCLSTLWPNLCSGGYVVFHDPSFEGVERAIRETIPDSEVAAKGTFTDSNNMGYIVKA